MINAGVPSNEPLVGADEIVTPSWYAFFVGLYNRAGGSSGNASALLDTIISTAGSMLVRGLTNWVGLLPGSHYSVLRMGATYPEWDTLDGNSFGSQTANKVFAAPSGVNGNTVCALAIGISTHPSLWGKP